MKTEKLYYKDAYIKEFSATVVSSYEKNGRFAVVLDKTAFFPEEGGQSADNGNINGVEVVDVREIDGVIEHFVDEPLEIGKVVECSISFCERFGKMQCHTAEHIISGLIHSLFGFDNIGFHLGKDYVTLDVNGILDRCDLDRIEDLANEAIYKNIPVSIAYPSSDELSSLEYRAKLDLTENVRIVNIGDYDSCACCAPHVGFTGEIGLIKILDFMKHRGGTRIHMLAGNRALMDYREKYKNILAISGMLCVPQNLTAEGLKTYIESASQTELELKSAYSRIVAFEAEKIRDVANNYVLVLEKGNINDAREIVNLALSRVPGVLTVLLGTDGDYKYVMASENRDMIKTVKEANAALCGRGGGRPPMMQGSFSATLKDIERFFHNLE